MTRLLVARSDALTSRRLAALSRAALDRSLGGAAELLVAVPTDEAVLLGAFQRAVEAGSPPGGMRRGSGGAAARVGPGTVWLQLALARVDALVACDPPRLLNRYVRPLLRGMTRAGATAHWFGRDWVSVASRPAAMVAFAHDAGTGRAFLEAVVAVSTPFGIDRDRERGTFRGAEPATLAELTGRADAHAVADAVAAAYAAAYEGTPDLREPPCARASEVPAAHELPPDDPPWQATREEALGVIGAGRDGAGRLRVGGELMASRDAVSALEAAVSAMVPLPTTADDAFGERVGRAVDATLGAPAAVTFGLRSLAAVRDVIVDALMPPRA